MESSHSRGTRWNAPQYSPERTQQPGRAGGWLVPALPKPAGPIPEKDRVPPPGPPGQPPRLLRGRDSPRKVRLATGSLRLSPRSKPGRLQARWSRQRSMVLAVAALPRLWAGEQSGPSEPRAAPPRPALTASSAPSSPPRSGGGAAAQHQDQAAPRRYRVIPPGGARRLASRDAPATHSSEGPGRGGGGILGLNRQGDPPSSPAPLHPQPDLLLARYLF